MASPAGRRALARTRLAAFFCALRLANTAASDVDAGGLLAADSGLPQQLAALLRAGEPQGASGGGSVGSSAGERQQEGVVPKDVQTAGLLALSALVREEGLSLLVYVCSRGLCCLSLLRADWTREGDVSYI